MKPIKVALAGFGAGGRIYNAPIIASVEALRITKILTSSPENIKAAKRDLPKASLVKDFTEILEDSEIDLVVITTPNQLHREYAEKALKAGKHVVVEKPITPTVKEAEVLIKLAQENGRILSVNHNRRWDSDIRTIKRILEEKRLGEVVEYEAHFDRFRPELKDSWKENKENAGNGILYDLGSHLIDQTLWLFGFPEEVFADLRIQRENSEVVDNFELLLFYPGLKITLKAGMMVKEPGPRYQVFGRKGCFRKWGMDVQEEALKKGIHPKDRTDWGVEPEDIWGKISSPSGDETIQSERGDYRKFYENIVASIRGEENLEVTPQQASNVIRIIELAIRSNSEKRVLPTN